MLHLCDLTIVYGHQRAALRSGLTDVTPLRVTRKHNPGITTPLLALVDMTQRPVLISFGTQPIDCAGSIGLVPGPTIETGVQKADIEKLRITLGIGLREIFRHRSADKALTVDSHIQVLQNDPFGCAGGKHSDIVGQAKMLGDLTRRVMVTRNHKNPNACFPETSHTFNEIEARVVILPVTVVEISGKQHKMDFLV